MNLVIRNYVSSALVVIISSVMLANIYNQSSRFAGQERVNTFSYYIGAGVVAQAENSSH